jgi:heat shock protein beta
LQEALVEQVDKVTLSNRLTTSPCTVLAAQYGVTGNMERIMKAQAYQNSQEESANSWALFKKKLEINPRHPVIVELLERVSNGETDEHTTDLANVLYNAAALRAGYGLKNDEMIDFANRIDRMIRENLGVDKEAQVEVNETEAEDKEVVDDDDTEEDDQDHDEL